MNQWQLEVWWGGFGGGGTSPLTGMNPGVVPVTGKEIKGIHMFQSIRVLTLNFKISSSQNSLWEFHLRINSVELSGVFSPNAVDLNPPLTSWAQSQSKTKIHIRVFIRKPARDRFARLGMWIREQQRNLWVDYLKIHQRWNWGVGST